MQSQWRAPRSLCTAGTADRLNAAGPFPAVCQSWCYSMTVSTSLGMCLPCLPLRTPHMTGPSYDPWKHCGFAPITAAGRWITLGYVPPHVSLPLPISPVSGRPIWGSWHIQRRLCVCVGGGLRISGRKKHGRCKRVGVIWSEGTAA